MRVLVVNAGSSSLKVAVVEGTEVVTADHLDAWDGTDTAAIRRVADAAGGIDAIGHRVVHGGPDRRGAAVLDAAVEAAIENLIPLAPLHQPRGLAGIRAARDAYPHVPAVVCFDTAFHATLPAAAFTYAVPAAWTQQLGIRRYGFHGLNHAWASRRAATMVGRPVDQLRTVVAHLGAGASLCAVAGGRSVDTTMGFTPLEGLMMATRSGSVDPGVILWLQRHHGLTADEIDDALEHRSGLLGVSEVSGDLRAVLAAAGAGDERARLAIDVYVHRLRAGIAAMTASLGGLDVLVFTGGVGEHATEVRSRTTAGLRFLGVEVDTGRNEAASTCPDDTDVTSDAAATGTVRTVVVHAREDLEIAAEVGILLGADRVSRRSWG